MASSLGPVGLGSKWCLGGGQCEEAAVADVEQHLLARGPLWGAGEGGELRGGGGAAKDGAAGAAEVPPCGGAPLRAGAARARGLG